MSHRAQKTTQVRWGNKEPAELEAKGAKHGFYFLGIN